MIRSTFAGFTTAQLGMAASQRALDVAGQNIANINTIGYTKQRLDVASLNLQKGDMYNSKSNIKVGFGAEMTAISQLRDPFLDAQYRSQISRLGTSDAHAAGFERLTPIFDEAVMDGIRDAFISLTSSLSTLSTQVGNQENDALVRSKMQTILNLFHDNAVRLQDVRDDIQTGFDTTDLGDLNQILENIAELNTNIKNSQILGNPALELKDQRNNLLDELGSYLPISVKYKDKNIGPGQTVEIMDVYFTDTNGEKHTLISDGRFSEFDADISGSPVTLSLMDADGNTVDVTNTIGSGTLKGTLDLLNKSGDFDGSDFKGIGYYEKALDSLVDTFANQFNELNKVKDENGNFIAGKENPLFVTTDGATGKNKFTALNIKIADDWANGTYGITASNKYVVVDKDKGTTANENILNMVKLLESKTVEFSVPVKNSDGTTRDVKFYTGNFHDCFANMEATLGIDYKATNTMLMNQISVLNETSNNRDAVSGVQLDEEGMDLLHYNQSYSAAARFMTTLDEALDKLINGTGVVGR